MSVVATTEPKTTSAAAKFGTKYIIDLIMLALSRKTDKKTGDKGNNRRISDHYSLSWFDWTRPDLAGFCTIFSQSFVKAK